jgi:hypothetical protein
MRFWRFVLDVSMSCRGGNGTNKSANAASGKKKEFNECSILWKVSREPTFLLHSQHEFFG